MRTQTTAQIKKPCPPGPPDLVAINGEDSTSCDFPIVSYEINHTWGGAVGYPSGDGFPYRAKITLKGEKGAVLADVFFHDDRKKMPANPKFGEPGFQKPFNLHFPMSVFDGVLHQLRNAPFAAAVVLFYYRPAQENQWAIGTLGNITPGARKAKARGK